MIFKTEAMTPGLYLVATPIGNARDITLRALDALASADVLVAEDTRVLRKLLEIHGIALRSRPLWSYHDHSGEGDRTRVVAAVEAGQSVAYASDAGTPLVADPGFKLVRSVLAAGLNVTALPGASALLTALVSSGLESDRFHFAGFLPTADAARRRALREMRSFDATLVLYESGRRVREILDVLCEELGGDRKAAVCRELTKRFESVDRGSLSDLASRPVMETRGEFVLLIGRSDGPMQAEADIDAALREALRTMRVKDAATAVAGAMNLNRRDVYQRALSLGREDI